MPGVTVEDMGHKMGLNGVDNAKLTFDNVRVPRENLLNKYSDVSPGLKRLFFLSINYFKTLICKALLKSLAFFNDQLTKFLSLSRWKVLIYDWWRQTKVFNCG
jgi:hypothetical protein